MTSTAHIHLDRLTHNMALLQELADGAQLWPAIKANAYGHGAEIVARHLCDVGFDTLSVAHTAEASALSDAGIDATFVLMSAMLPDEAAEIVRRGFEPAVCTLEMIEALADEADNTGKPVFVHLMVDTGMGRVGIRTDKVGTVLKRCRALPMIRVKGLMSHFPRADEADKSYSIHQLADFNAVVAAAQDFTISVRHMANSAAIFDVPGSALEAARPGISIYGLAPSATIANVRVQELQPVLEWKTRITFLKCVPPGMGLSYGHTFLTKRDSLIATIPVGYGDGLHRNLSNRMEVLVGGRRCPQIGRITMDQSLIDVTDLGNEATLGDEVVIIGRQGSEEVTADELAATLGTINYEVVTAIAARVPRVVA